jgi:hypothetical protein
MLYHIYCDESRQTKDRYMVLGGLILDAENVAEFHATMAKFRRECRMFAELKWGKVSSMKLEEYRRFIDYFFALNDTEHVHFHSLIIDTSQLDHHAYNQGDKELGFYKFYYQLLLHSFGRKYCRKGENNRFIVHLDYRNTHYKLGTLKTVLNNGMKKKLGIDTAPFRAVEPRDSKESELMQIADILLGAVGYQKNGYNLLAGVKAAKIELADYIAKKAGLPNLMDTSPWGMSRFTIWNFRLSPRGGKKKTP